MRNNDMPVYGTPEERFREFVRFQERLVEVAKEEGHSKEEAWKLLFLWQLANRRG